MKTLLALILGIGAGTGLIWWWNNSQNTGHRVQSPKHRQHPMRPSKSITSPVKQQVTVPFAENHDSPGQRWFRGQIQAFSNDLLAYFIAQEALNCKLTAAQTIELYEKYKQVPLRPDIKEYEAGFREQGLTMATLAEIAVMWLKDNGVEAGTTNWEQQISAFLETKQETAAKQIIQDYLKV